MTPGQTIFVNVVCYGFSTAHYYIKNEATGVANSFDASFSAGFTGLHAEWTIARTEGSSDYPPLAD